MVSNIDGNAKYSHHPGDSSPIASDHHPPTMAWIPESDASDISPTRPPLNSQQSSSLPSTPYQHARNLSFHSRSPSPARGSTSPRSTHSESTHLPPSARKPLGGCKYETAMAFFRRRIPYSLGADILPEEREGLKEKLDDEEEKKLTVDIMELYDRLLPSAESDDRRRQLVRKLEKLFNDQWPGHDIKANVFGSSGNKLCSSDSDVDICITTNFKELEHVCLLAEVLAQHGMQRVVCVSHAKVPIVKIWDPELKLACDMNVNNTLALENTRMIRTYVEVDERVRPLAMAVKHWTKRRILNDAALGGTLSSYTWICLIINFLQTRDPPVLPSLQARPHKKRVTPDGLVCSFDDDMKSLNGFGQKNKRSVGELLFDFFRYYGHELDYEQNVISVREGTLVNKKGKGWHLLMNNRLCVEEPFNNSRNLGNTADDTSFRGLHMELRRAFKHVSTADLAGCCDQFEFPPEEERTWERPPPQPRPIITPSLPTRGGRGGGRGGRYPNQFRGGFSGGRRTSNTGNKGNNNTFRQPTATSANDLSLQAQQQAQYMLHDQLFQQIQLLQAQEQELRMQLANQALITGRTAPANYLRQPFIQFPVPQQQEFSADESSRSRSGTVNQPPLTPSHRQHQQPFFAPTYASVSASGTQASTTNPSSPSATTALPDLRRNPRRSSAASGSPKGSLRAQSQPARPQNSPSLQSFPSLYAIPQPLDTSFGSKQRPAPESSEGGEGSSGDENAMPPNSLPSNGSRSGSVDENRPQDLLGYYLTPQQLQLFQQNQLLSPMGLTLPNGYTSLLPVQQDYRTGSLSTDGSPSQSDQVPMSTSRSSVSQPPPPRSASRPAAPVDRGPLIVDGSVPPSENRASSYPSDLIDPYTAVTHYTSTSDDHNMNTPASFSDSLSQDFQDPGPFEMDPPAPLSRAAPFDGSKMTNGNGNGNADAHSDKSNSQPELLASRLQNYHLSNAEKLAQSHAIQKTNSKPTPSHQGTTKDSSPSKNSSSPSDKASNGSHGNESRQQTSNSKRRPNGVDASEKVNGANHSHSHGHNHGHNHHKPKSKGRHDTSNAGNESRKSGGATTNGTTENGHGGWQTTKKKNRRSGKPSPDSRNGIHGGPEPLPADESMRKGG
ncbi:hypothetical protein N7456_002415 [Penicillium angulare]|uniref:polynucleotide adenylyltransferase n=1 Tax=Penicillium angulare TaxID=116970 RepID=A0A9W9KQ85_9EURO|nr:hypothetical protein N7456_002415 [Penicillium angulare]